MAQTAISRRYTAVRIIQFGLAVGVLGVGMWIAMGHVYADFFFPIALALIVPTLLSEPYFVGPRMAIGTSASQIGAYFSSDRSTATALWNLLLVVSLAVAVSSLVAMLRNERAGQFFHWFSTRVGRAVLLGSITTTIVLLQIADKSSTNASQMAAVFILVYAILFLDWARLTLLPSSLQPKMASITSVYGPNQLLVNSFGQFETASHLKVVGPAGVSNAYVAEELASGSGSQYRLVLEKHWRSVADGSDEPVTLSKIDEGSSIPRGFAIQGSSETSVRVNPTSVLKVGETLELRDESGPLLYQVTALHLEEETWSGSSAIVPRATLIQVGAIDQSGMIVARPTLPTPYQPLYSAADASGRLDANAYLRIGTLKGTSVEVGIRKDWLSNHGHLAILGMSGMGKTTIAAKIAQLAQVDDKFVILDETSEYRSRLNFSVTPPGTLDWTAAGVEVYEPGGEMPASCEIVVQNAMAAASTEYASGSEPRRRFVLLEEAHGWLPEWNFTSRNNADAVNRTCRYILQARKFNLTFVMVSQRTAVISKSAISQCENYIILRTLDQTSLEYVEGVIGQELRGLLSELGKYEAVCVGPLFNSDSPIVVSLEP